MKQLKATDQDSPNPSGDIKFSITFNDPQQEGLVAINATSGEVYVNQTLDRESYEEIVLTVTATDQGPHLSTRKI